MTEKELKKFIKLQETVWQGLMQKLPKSAVELKKKSCVQCSKPCWVRPGLLARPDLERLAMHYRMSESEFFKQFCMADEISGEYFVVLRRKHQQGGSFVNVAESYSVQSPCVFLDENTRLCTVHAIKPQQCQNYKCWENTETDISTLSWTLGDLEKIGYLHKSPFQDMLRAEKLPR